MPARSLEPYQQLEIEWAKWNDLDPAGMVACASGSSALHLALEAFQLPPGSEVVTSDFNMIAVPRAISLAGLTPVFVDCDERLLMDQELAIKAICCGNRNPVTRAVIFVHIYGRQLKILDYGWPALEDQVYVIEDLAEAHGVRPAKCTDAACWSHYQNKVIGGAEGGTVWFRDPEKAKLARQLRSLGFTDAHDFMHVPRGINARMSNPHARLILNTLESASLHMKARRLIEDECNQHCPDEWKMPPRESPWIFDIRIPGMDAATQARVVKSLNAADIPARHAFKPMHVQPEYRDCRRVGGDMADRLSREIIYLPLIPLMSLAKLIEKSFDIIHRTLAV